MKRKLFILTLITCLLQISFLISQEIFGGYKECTEYLYKYKDGVLDSNSRHKVRYSVYNDSGYSIEEIHYSDDNTVSCRYTDIYNDKMQRIRRVDYNAYD